MPLLVKPFGFLVIADLENKDSLIFAIFGLDTSLTLDICDGSTMYLYKYTIMWIFYL